MFHDCFTDTEERSVSGDMKPGGIQLPVLIGKKEKKSGDNKRACHGCRVNIASEEVCAWL
jgi:hypothetical protein